MDLTLGIDTGGTYTDAAIVSRERGQLLCSAKALTTPGDLALGIVHVVDRLDAALLPHVGRVCLSTTLATNAVVEGKGGRVFLFLLGHDQRTIDRFHLADELPSVEYALLAGRMGQRGEELTPLDADGIRRIARERADQVDAFAISGYFAVKNPAHEQAARGVIREVCDRPVVCGHELSAQLDCMRRATTSVLNAQLLPIVRTLIEAVRGALAERNMGHAMLLVMRGDGSLMPVEAAHARPIETTLSGPAASAIGARHLVGQDEAIVIDMGGTTTDLAVLSGGEPRVCNEGALVGGFRTHVRACDMATMGLGGDSHLRADAFGELVVGPRRAVPLGLLASEFPQVVAALERHSRVPRLARSRFAADFALLRADRVGGEWSPRERALLAALADGPCPLIDLAERLSALDPSLLPLERLEASGAIMRAALTPTDVLLAMGRLQLHDPRASRIGALMLADQLGLRLDELHARVVDLMAERIALFTLRQTLAADLPIDLGGDHADAILRASLAPGDEKAIASLAARVAHPVIAIGAPVGEYFPAAAEKMRARLLIPEHAGVANAIGAAVGRLRRVVEIEVRPVYQGAALSHYAVHSQEELSEWPSLEEAIARAEEIGERIALRDLHGAISGHDGAVVESRHLRRSAQAKGSDSEVLMGVIVRTSATIEAVPGSARQASSQ